MTPDYGRVGSGRPRLEQRALGQWKRRVGLHYRGHSWNLEGVPSDCLLGD